MAGTFQYTTITRLREEGVDTASASDSRLRTLISLVGEIINSVTGQCFNPVRRDIRLDGKNDRLISIPNRLPFIDVDDLSIVVDGSPSTALETNDFYIAESNRRILEIKEEQFFDTSISLIQRTLSQLVRPRFPLGTAIIRISGVFGFLELKSGRLSGNNNVVPSSAVTTTLVDDVSTSVTLDTVDGFRENDIIEFLDADQNQIALTIVNSVDRSSNILNFDAMGDFGTANVPAGSTVESYGHVPLPVQEAANRLVIGKLAGLGTDEGLEAEFQRRLFREKTDKYEYELSGPIGGTGANGSSPVNTTGDAEADKLLDNYTVGATSGTIQVI